MLTDVVIANKSYTKMNVTEGKAVDNIALMVMKQDCPDFLLPLKTIEIDGELELRYEFSDGIRLCYSNLKMGKKEFTVLLKNMLTPYKICNDWFLDYHNILLDANYIMVGKKGQTIRYLYIPVAEYAHSDGEIMDFFCNMVLKAEIEDDPRYAMTLLRVLKADNANLITLLNYISQEQKTGVEPAGTGSPVTARDDRGNSPAGELKTQKGLAGMCVGTAGGADNTASGSGGAARPGQMPKEFGKQDMEGKLMGSLFGEDEEDDLAKKKKKKESGRFFFKGKGKGKKQQSNEANMNQGAAPAVRTPEVYAGADNGFAQNGWQNQSGFEGGDATEIDGGEEDYDNSVVRLGLEDGAGFNCPKFIEIDLQKGFATIGRIDKSGHGQADFNFDASLSFVSRVHLRIERVGEQWQIIDLGSKNGTFLNGEALVPNMAYPLHTNDRIMFSAKNRLIYRVC